jgi:hypothetical protein
VYGINIAGVESYIHASDTIIGKSQDSWKFLFGVATKVFQQKENTFGYFVYSPDVLGYGPKYAMAYATTVYKKRAESFVKKPTTYLIIAPPPSNNPYMKDAWWTKNQIYITPTPVFVIHFPNGYKIEKYLLDKDEVKIPFDERINTGIHFR